MSKIKQLIFLKRMTHTKVVKKKMFFILITLFCLYQTNCHESSEDSHKMIIL